MSNNEKNITKKQAIDFLEEFKNFVFKGNVINLSVSIIIGGAFNKIISSLVDNIIMPMTSIVLPVNSGYKDWCLTILGNKIQFGVFIGDVITFLIISCFLFIFIKKILQWIVETKSVIETTKDQEILIEIRNLLLEEFRTRNKH
jgi:large conductance mechanosensitive channel